jgi:sRNA-binding protein
VGSNERRKEAEEAGKLIRAKFPLCFTTPKRPLKIGISDDLRAQLPDMKFGLIKHVVNYYTDEYEYQACLTDGAERLDLEGNAVGRVTLQEARYAAWRSMGISESRVIREQLWKLKGVEKAARALVQEGVGKRSDGLVIIDNLDLYKVLFKALSDIAKIVVSDTPKKRKAKEPA